MIAILGGGLSGLQLGRSLQGRGIDFLILEKGERPGGLCRTMRSGDYSWDIGPHAFYSKKPEAMAYYRALPLRYAELARDVRVCHHGPSRVHEVGYPFENGLAELPLKHRLDCAAGYCAASAGRRSGDFRDLKDWIDRGLGFGISKHFMTPYNLKIWDCPLEQVSMDLVRQKIEPEPAWKVVRNAFFRGSVGRAYQARFIYPEEGAGSVTDSIAAQVESRLRLGFSVKKLERLGAGWRISGEGGEPVEAEVVVSTIPVPELLDAAQDPALLAYRREFRSNDTLFAVLGLKRGSDFNAFKTCQWVFFAGPELFYRVTLMHNFTSRRLPTLVAEITRKGETAGMAGSDILERVIKDCLACGILCSREDVAFTQTHLERYTYPIPTVGLQQARSALEERLAAQGIHLLGRSGRWDYLNTDGIFMEVERFMRGMETWYNRSP